MSAPKKPPQRKRTPAGGMPALAKPTRRPSYDPVELAKQLGSSDLSSTIPPPSSTTSLEEELVLPEQRFFDRLDERARRAELLVALLQAKGMSTERALRALQAALGAIVASAEDARLQSLATLGTALQAALGELGSNPARSLDVLVLDETEISRDLVALAVEAQGHMVRSAGSYDDFVRHLDERLPDLIVTDVELSNAPARQFCATLSDLLANRPVPIVFFSSMAPDVLAELAKKTGAIAAMPKDRGIAGLITELERILPKI
jgi:CheY-like chemotaxis protein